MYKKKSKTSQLHSKQASQIMLMVCLHHITFAHAQIKYCHLPELRVSLANQAVNECALAMV